MAVLQRGQRKLGPGTDALCGSSECPHAGQEALDAGITMLHRGQVSLGERPAEGEEEASPETVTACAGKAAGIAGMKMRPEQAGQAIVSPANRRGLSWTALQMGQRN
jgi:hypothetical protein